MKKRVLLADDSPVIQSLTRKILETQGFEFTGVKNGSAVLGLLEKEKYDAVILDIIMPDLNGLELAKRIRSSEIPAVRDVPIIGISGNYMNYSDEALSEAGFNEFFLKPINYDHLLNAIKKYTDS